MNTEKTKKLNRNISIQGRLFTMKKLFLFVVALSVCVSAADLTLEERVGSLQAQVDRAMSRAGIQFSGEFRGQFLDSRLDGDAMEPGKMSESVQFTSVDFNILARPNSMLGARAIFRMHQDWRNFFSDVQNPIATRWLSIDGSVADGIVKYNIGDYRKRLSPLTLWTPEIELLYEPEIFAAARRYAMSESFLGENKRMMQGFNVEFDAVLYPILKRVQFDLFGARLATRGAIESAVIPPGVGENTQYIDAPFDKYLLGVNLATQVIDGAGIGISNIAIFDQISSSVMNEDGARRTQDPQSTNIFAVRANADNRTFMEDELINVGVNVEVALSSDKRHMGTGWSGPEDDRVTHTWRSGANFPDGLNDVKWFDSTTSGLAVVVGLAARLSLGGEDHVKLGVNYMNNDGYFMNDAVQSPSFIQRRVMNNENALLDLGLLNPFDAMYRTVYKFAPSQYFGGTSPQSKHGYNSAIITGQATAGLSGHSQVYYPNVFQAAMPGGLGTADRTGPVIDFDARFLENAITVGARAAILNSVSDVELGWEYINPDPDAPLEDLMLRGSIPAFNSEFSEMVFGFGVDAAKLVPTLGRSLFLGFSYGMYNSKTGMNFSREMAEVVEGEANMVSVGLNYHFHQRFNLMAGYQLLNVTNTTTSHSGENETSVRVQEYKFDNLAFGIGYRVADGGDLVVKLTRLSGENVTTGRNYSALQPEVFLTVKF
jgi:hypothetical protein